MHAGETKGSGNDVRPARARPFAARTRQVEAAVLCAVAAGASPAAIAARLGASDPALDRAEIERQIANLQRRGLLRPNADPENSASNLTGSGRQTILDLVAHWLSTAEELEAERQQVERLRTDLLSTISHELRTPLTLIRTSIGLLLDSDPDEAMRLRLLRNIQQSSERMHALVNDLLDLARLRGDRFSLQTRTVDTGALVAGAVSLMRPLLDAKEQDVALAIPTPAPTIVGDYRRLERVLLNLLGNATTFAPMGTTITVTVHDGAREVTIAVQDAGPGIAAEAMPYLFEQFFTSRTSSSRHNIGVGLGLPIAQGIVAAHGGRIWVDSALGTGTTVTFTLPKVALQEEPNEGVGGR
jgi:signal transduction histidine kinase